MLKILIQHKIMDHKTISLHHPIITIYTIHAVLFLLESTNRLLINVMSVFTAHYYSHKADSERVNGLFDFESDNRLGSKALEKDARLAMLERYGNKSIS